MINWQDSFSMGIDSLDEQHKNLFRYSNELEEGIKQGVVSKQALNGALRFLVRYSKVHFDQEETLMEKFSCPVAQKDKFAHQAFIEKYKMFQNMIGEDEGNDLILKEFHRYVEGWLIDHVGKIDIQLKHCVDEYRGLEDQFDCSMKG